MAGHLAREAPRRDHVDVDVLGHQLLGQDAGQLVQRRLARPVGIGLFAERGDPRHRADVDDPRRALLAAGLAQQRQQLLDAVEHRRDVQLHALLPARHRIAFQRRAPGGAGVVDQDVQLADLSRQLRRQGLHPGFAGQVGGDPVAFAQGAQLGGGLRAGLGIAGADIDPGAGLDETLGDHLADAAGAAGDQGGTAFQGEVRGHDGSSVRWVAVTLAPARASDGALSRRGMAEHRLLVGASLLAIRARLATGSRSAASAQNRSPAAR
ncbi:hypothetical protein D9M70_312320 [compost metagenome]